MEEDLENFIDERINKKYYKLRQTNKWKEAMKEYNTAYSNLFKQLDEKQKNQLDKIIDMKNLLMSYESQFAYRIGFTDFVKTFKI